MDNKEKILLADDYIDVFADLKTIFIKKGYEVHSEMNKIEALRNYTPLNLILQFQI